MLATIDFSIELPVYPERVYRAWLDSGEHTKFTGQPAEIQEQEGGHFRALDGAVESRILTLSPHDRIRQTWDLAGIPISPGQAEIELVLEPTCSGTMLKLQHSGLAPDQTHLLLAWWEETYLRPLLEYFEALVGDYPADMGDG